MKLLQKIGLTEAQTKIIIKVFVLSIILCTVTVLGFRLFQSNAFKIKKLKDLKLTEDVNKVISLDVDANLEVALRHIQSNDYETAIPHLKRVLEIIPKHINARYQLANAYLESGLFGKAIEHYDILSQNQLSDTLTGQVCARRAICQFYLNQKTESMEALRQCIETHPPNAEAFCFLGQIEASREMPSQKALDYFNKSISIDSSYVEAWYQLARYSMDLHDFVKARDLLIKAIDLNPLHEKSHSRLGMVYYYLHDNELAKKSYQTALALNPSDFNTRYNLGEVYYSEGDSVRAAKEFKETLRYNPGHVEANFKLGLLLLSNNMIKEAIIHLEQAAYNNPNNVRILIQLAVAYEKFNDKEKAVEYYSKVLDIDNMNIIAKQKLKYLKG